MVLSAQPFSGRRSVRSRLLTLAVTATAALGLVVVAPVIGGPSADPPKPVKSAVQDIALGDASAPAKGVQVRRHAAGNAPGESQAEGAPLANGVTTLRLTRPSLAGFSCVGLTWAGTKGAANVVAKVRVKITATGKWSRWTTLQINTDTAPNPAATAQRAGTDPYWFGASSGVEISVDVPDATTAKDLKLTLIDPKKVSQDANPSASRPTDEAGAAVAQPYVYTRAQWGADESQRHWDPQYTSTLKAATVHHTADSNNYSSADVPGIMRSIYRYQAVSRGWGDIGYNVVVDKWGRMWEGRYGGLASTVIGAHAGGFNAYTFGVSMLGNYDVTPVPAAVSEALAKIIAWKFRLYGIDPTSRTALTQHGGAGTTAKFQDGQTISFNTIFGHRDSGFTVCPGRYGYAMLPGLRVRVAQLWAQRAEVYLRNSNTTGLSQYQIVRGLPGDQVAACDWNGDGRATLAYFRRGDWYLFNANPPEQAVAATFHFGAPGDVPICGDWDGDGRESVGVYRPSTQRFYVRNHNSTGLSDANIILGLLGDTPIVGDWDNNGQDTVGVFRNGAFYFVNSVSAGAARSGLQMGGAGDKPVVGDFDRNGADSVGVMRGSRFYLSNNRGSGVATDSLSYGSTPQQPLMADWDGDGSDTLGVVQ